jgi:UDP-2,4-diacetamido-2,4,6-trideoxy-beta-L-altropyranose hydrolase
MSSTPDPGHLLLVADSRPDSGLGHVQRSLALAEAWIAAGGQASALVGEDTPDVTLRVAGAGVRPISVRDPMAPDAIARIASEADWCVLDGYGFDAVHHEAGSRAGALAVIDDHGRSGLVGVDAVIDHNHGVAAETYAHTEAVVAAGSTFTMLRRDHVAAAPDAVDARDRLVVVMGGSPAPATVAHVGAVLEALDLPSELVDLVGMGDLAASGTTGRRCLIDRVAPLGSVFRSARLALSAAGSTTWELAAAGTPVVLVAVADNQEPVGRAADAAHFGRYLGPIASVSPCRAAALLEALWYDSAELTAMSSAGRSVIDGRGAHRVVAMLRSTRVRLRSAVMDDARLLWEWVNDEQVRAMAFDSRPIAWAEHCAWLEDRLARRATSMYIAEDDRGPWGQVRFDVGDDREAVIDISVTAPRRGAGLAAPLLIAAVNRLAVDRTDVERVRAEVKPANRGSARAFDLAAFDHGGEGDPVVYGKTL